MQLIFMAELCRGLGILGVMQKMCRKIGIEDKLNFRLISACKTELHRFNINCRVVSVLAKLHRVLKAILSLTNAI